MSFDNLPQGSLTPTHTLQLNDEYPLVRVCKRSKLGAKDPLSFACVWVRGQGTPHPAPHVLQNLTTFTARLSDIDPFAGVYPVYYDKEGNQYQVVSFQAQHEPLVFQYCGYPATVKGRGGRLSKAS